MKPAISNLACSWGLPKPIIKSHQKKKWVWPGLGTFSGHSVKVLLYVVANLIAIAAFGMRRAE